ncbi:MAG: O-antigen ligase family protein [Deltaproteobacteria bacterium]|nr:O-antigen ligase family protein [Deltaproteobacteria bacterium]
MQIPQENSDVIRSSFFVHWAAWPFLLAALLYGLPISGELPAQQQFTEQFVSKVGDDKTLVYIFVHGGLYLLAIVAILKYRSKALYVFMRQWPLVALTLLVGFSAFWSNSPWKACINFGHTVGVLMIALSAALSYRNEPALLVRFLGYALGLNVLLSMIAVLAIPQVSIELHGRWRGLTSNSNVLGQISFTAAWALGMTCLLKRYRKKFVLIVLLLLTVISLIGTQSKTALICTVLGLSVGYFMIRYSHMGSSKTLFSIFFFFMTLVFVLLLFFWGNAWEDLSPVGMNHLLGRSESYTGRTKLWTSAIQLITQKLWLGHGFDDTAGGTNSIRLLNSHNGFLDLAVRGGITAVLLFLIALWKVIRNIPNISAIQRNAWAIFFPYLLAFLAYNLTESTIMNPRNLSWTIFMFIAFIVEIQHLPLDNLGKL